MQIQKIKTIDRQILSTLKTSPNTLLLKDCSLDFPSMKCSLCEDIKRQNYHLKQELYEFQEKTEKQSQREKQLIALRQLYELKCREIELMNSQLSQCTEKISQLKQKNQLLVDESIKTFESVI